MPRHTFTPNFRLSRKGQTSPSVESSLAITMNSTVIVPDQLDSLIPTRLTNAETRKRLLEDPDFMEKGVLGCFLSPSVRDEDVAAYWASISLQRPSAAGLMQLVVASCNIAQRGLGVATSDVAFALLARFGDTTAEDPRWSSVTAESFSKTAASCVETAILLFRPAAIQPLYYRDLDTKAGAAIREMTSAAKSDEARKQACLALIGWLRTPPPVVTAVAKRPAAKKKTGDEKREEMALVFYETANKRELFLDAARLYPRASAASRARLEELCRRCIWSGGGIAPNALLEMQSTSWIPSKLLLACFREPEQAGAQLIFIRSQIRALMSYPLSYVPDNVDEDPGVEPQSLMWPFWELEELLAAIDDACKQSVRPEMCAAVLERWNLVCSVVKSFLGPVRYNVWIANAGRIYCARIGMILTLNSDTVVPTAKAALYRPREYPLALRPVIRFLVPKGFGAPVLVGSSINPMFSY